MAGMLQVPYGKAVVQRVAPLMPPGMYKTYAVTAPVRTHWKPAPCELAGCEAYRSGWVTAVDIGTEQGQRQAHFILHDATRSHTVQRVGPRVVRFVFGPGQRCFSFATASSPSGTHLVRIPRPDRFLVAGGDFRGNPSGYQREHKRAEDWVEDFSEHQDRLATAIQRG